MTHISQPLMLWCQKYFLYGSFSFYLVVQIVCCIIIWYRGMNKQKLTSIPESNENEDLNITQKWVPKKKHEVLKAKYKCLKKLFQIYDASVVSILPHEHSNDPENHDGVTQIERKKRSCRTKTDACAGAKENTSGDATKTEDEKEKDLVVPTVVEDLNETCCSTDNASVTDTKNLGAQCECTQTSDIDPAHPAPSPSVVKKEKRSRFQIFLQRILGIRKNRSLQRSSSNRHHIYLASENLIMSHIKRKRRGLRFSLLPSRRFQSDAALKSVVNPAIMMHVQTVQKNCLKDKTPRCCPIRGCGMIAYGIINYNDHLNLSHFTDRKYICHYCHKGYEKEYEKFLHENQHLGIPSLNFPSINIPCNQQPYQNKPTSPEERENIPEEKLKKIVSFFDKIDPEAVLLELKKKVSDGSFIADATTESSIQSRVSSGSSEVSEVWTDQRSIVRNDFCESETSSRDKRCSTDEGSCYGENNRLRRQQSLNVHTDPKLTTKYFEYHWQSGVIKYPIRIQCNKQMELVSQDGKIQVQSIDRSHKNRIIATSSSVSQASISSRRKSDENIMASGNNKSLNSTQTLKKTSAIDNFVKKVKQFTYKWEPGT